MFGNQVRATAPSEASVLGCTPARALDVASPCRLGRPPKLYRGPCFLLLQCTRQLTKSATTKSSAAVQGSAVEYGQAAGRRCYGVTWAGHLCVLVCLLLPLHPDGLCAVVVATMVSDAGRSVFANRTCFYQRTCAFHVTHHACILCFLHPSTHHPSLLAFCPSVLASE
jgi:hypothetical protein